MNNLQSDSFWKPKSLAALAAEQGISAPHAFEELHGAGAELFEDFITSIDRHRREATSA